MNHPYPDRVIREPERRAITGVATASWYLLMGEGLAPRPIPIGKRSVGWLLSELTEWVAEQATKRPGKIARHAAGYEHRDRQAP